MRTVAERWPWVFLPSASLGAENRVHFSARCARVGSRSRNGGRMARFAGTEAYVATEDLTVAVNAAITLERPLLVKGEPGTGKSVLAEEIARSLNAPLLTWHIKSTTKAQQGLYEYDAVSR